MNADKLSRYSWLNLAAALLLVLCVQLQSPPRALAQSQSPSVIAERAMPSVVLLVALDANKKPVSFGSGFFISPAVAVTNHHVCAGASYLVAKAIGQKNGYQVTKILVQDAKSDLAVIEIPGLNLPGLKLAGEDPPKIGDPVYAIGNPEGLEGTFSIGNVSAVREMREGVTMVQITAPISPGSSGGPLLNADGKVIGISCMVARNGQNLNFAVPVSYLHGLLSRVDLKSVPRLPQDPHLVGGQTPLQNPGASPAQSGGAQPKSGASPNQDSGGIWFHK